MKNLYAKQGSMKKSFYRFFYAALLGLSLLGASQQAKAQLMFTEIMYNPPESGTDSLEFIEMYNAGASGVDMNGYTLAFGGLVARYTFTTSYIVPAGGFVVWAVNPAALVRNYNLSFTPLAWTSSGLSNTSTNIKLFSGTVTANPATVVDSVLYANSWVAGSNGSGKSMVFCPSSGNNSISTNWAASAVNSGKTVNSFALYGSPGALECGCTTSITSQPTSTTVCEGISTSFSVAATGSGTLSYQWKKGSTPIGANSNILSLTNVSAADAGVYSVDVIGTCSVTSNTVTLTVNALPTLTVSNGAICSGDSYVIQAAGANTYTYTSGSNTVSPTSNTSYTVSGTDGNGCTGYAVSSVTVNALPTLTVSSGAICVGDSYVIQASGANTYTYSSGSNTVAPAADASYTVSGTDGNGCVGSAVSSVTIYALPTLTVTTSHTMICAGQSASLTASGASTYTWSTAESGSVIAVSPTITTTYSVNGTDIHGCSNATNINQDVSVCTYVNSVSDTSGTIFDVYPNPSNGTLNIELTSNSNAYVQILNSLGDIVYSGTVNASSQHNLQHLADGVYFVRIAVNHQQYVKRLVIQH